MYFLCPLLYRFVQLFFLIREYVGEEITEEVKVNMPFIFSCFRFDGDGEM